MHPISTYGAASMDGVAALQEGPHARDHGRLTEAVKQTRRAFICSHNSKASWTSLKTDRSQVSAVRRPHCPGQRASTRPRPWVSQALCIHGFMHMEGCGDFYLPDYTPSFSLSCGQPYLIACFHVRTGPLESSSSHSLFPSQCGSRSHA
jgi:hypothetical protein